MPLPIADDARVTMSMHDYRRIEAEFDALRNKAVALESAALPAPPAETDLRHALDNALEIVQFAVANLPAESVRGWPHEALSRLAGRLPVVYPGDADRTQLSITFTAAAGECREVEAIRAGRVQAAASILAHVADVENAVENTAPADSP